MSSSGTGILAAALMNFVQDHSRNKHAIADFDQLKEEFLEDVIATVEMEEIPPTPKLILN